MIMAKRSHILSIYEKALEIQTKEQWNMKRKNIHLDAAFNLEWALEKPPPAERALFCQSCSGWVPQGLSSLGNLEIVVLECLKEAGISGIKYYLADHRRLRWNFDPPTDRKLQTGGLRRTRVPPTSTPVCLVHKSSDLLWLACYCTLVFTVLRPGLRI